MSNDYIFRNLVKPLLADGFIQMINFQDFKIKLFFKIVLFNRIF